MKKRIYKNMMLLSVVGLLLLSFLNSAIFYYSLTSTVKEDLRGNVQFARQILDTQKNNSDNIKNLNLSQPNFRFSLIDPQGQVLCDSAAKIETLGNHSDREEVRQALEKGFGETKRFSSTLGTETYYYAVKLADGSILRTSKTLDSIFGIFIGQLPFLLLMIGIVLLLGNYMALKLSKKIVEPINAFDFESNSSMEYDELAPLVRTMERQRGRIAEQISDLEKKVQTIRLITDTMKEGIILLDHKGLIVSANKSALRIFDIPEQMEGKNILEISRHLELLENIKETFSGQSRDMRYEANQRVYRVFFSPATENGAIILFLDITEADQAEQRRREFSANVSHELKTPLTSISGYAEMIYSGMAKEEDIQRFSGKIKDDAARLIHLIEDIIMISELDENIEAYEREEVDVSGVSKEVLESLATKAEGNHIALHTQGNLILRANRRMIYELLYNLVDNGIQYNKDQGEVRICLNEDDGFGRILVEDTGVGIPEEYKDRIFERFYRVDSSRSKKTGGTGLGLSIVKHIVQAHGGKIQLADGKLGGTVVEIIIPQK